MDPLTHAASGAAAMLAFSNRPMSRLAAPFAAIACASPDIDLIFIRSPLDFLLLHRGITHSFAFAPLFGLFLALLFWPLWSRKTPGAWRFWEVWLFCCAMLLLHIWLDVVTTYGTMVFLPFSHYRVRLNSLYMIDPAVTLPLLWAICFWRKRPKLQAAVLVWIFLLPGGGIFLNHWHKNQVMERFAAENRRVDDVHILPDAMAPLFWRALYREHTPDGPVVRDMGLDWLGRVRNAGQELPGIPLPLEKRFKETSLDGEVFFDFVILPVWKPLPEQYKPEAYLAEDSFFLSYDLRFGSNLAWMQKLLEMRPDAELPFLFMAEFGKENQEHTPPGEIKRLRLRFSDSGRDSLWHGPIRPSEPDFWQWLVGLR